MEPGKNDCSRFNSSGDKLLYKTTKVNDTDSVATLEPETPSVKQDKYRACWSRLKSASLYLGPAWIVAMAYVDPGNLEGDFSAGALRHPDDPNRGFRLLWVLVWATIIGFYLQRLAIKLGVSTGKDLATLAYKYFPRWVSYGIWIVTELCLAGVDAQAVIGTAIALNLLFNIPIVYGICLTVLDTVIILLTTVSGTQKLEIFFGIMIFFMGCCFFVNMGIAGPPVKSLVEGLLVPQVPGGTLSFAVVLIGSVIMPHNFFLQTSVIQTRNINRTSLESIKRVTNIYVNETFIALFSSLFINAAVVSSFATISLQEGQTLSLYTAHVALEKSLGKASSVVWALGLMSAGTCSTIAGTYTGQYLFEGLLNIRIKRLWLRTLVTRVISIVPVLMILSSSQQTTEFIVDAVNVMQALCTPFVVVMLIKFSSSSQVMGDNQISLSTKILSYAAGGALIVINIAFLVGQVLEVSTWLISLLVIYVVGIIWFWSKPVLINDINSCLADGI